jgi:thiol:disulfide interchange protein
MSEQQLKPSPNNSVRNIVIAIAAAVLSVALFLGFQTENSSSSLASQAKQATALEVALNNNRPTLTEFYADWCNSCQAMAGDLAQIKKSYGDRINFVMLNVDNTKWLPEMMRYRVDGIPHFLFMNTQGEAIAQAIGEQPKNILEANLEALIANKPIPYGNQQGQISTVEAKVTVTNDTTDPRSVKINKSSETL